MFLHQSVGSYHNFSQNHWLQSDEVQGGLPQNVTLWYVSYFELEFKKPLVQEETFVTLETGNTSQLWKASSDCPEVEGNLIIRDREYMAEKAV